MEYRKLGNLGIEVSSLSFGASSLGGVFHDINEKEGIRTVHTAIDNGINFIDVSPYYGFTKAETVLGKALKEIPRHKYYLSTKVGRYGENGVKSWDYSAKRAIASVDESLKRLNIDYIDIINVHDIEFSYLSQVINETLPALVSLKKQGKVGHVGITGLPLALFRKVIDAVPEGTVESILSFCHYCLNDDSLLDEVPYYQQKNIGIINASPLSMGLLSHRGAPDWHPAPDQLQKVCIMAATYCKSQGYRIEQLAVKYSTEHPDISTTLVSTANPDNILQNIRWTEEPQNEELLQEVKDILAPAHRMTWKNS
jgi:L-galactose dehydrogenase